MNDRSTRPISVETDSLVVRHAHRLVGRALDHLEAKVANERGDAAQRPRVRRPLCEQGGHGAGGQRPQHPDRRETDLPVVTERHHRQQQRHEDPEVVRRHEHEKDECARRDQEAPAFLVQTPEEEIQRPESEERRVRRVMQIVGVLNPEWIDDPQRERELRRLARPVKADELVDEEQRGEREHERHQPELHEVRESEQRALQAVHQIGQLRVVRVDHRRVGVGHVRRVEDERREAQMQEAVLREVAPRRHHVVVRRRVAPVQARRVERVHEAIRPA